MVQGGTVPDGMPDAYGTCDERARMTRYSTADGRLTTRWSGRVKDKVPSSYNSARAAQLNR